MRKQDRTAPHINILFNNRSVRTYLGFNVKNDWPVYYDKQNCRNRVEMFFDDSIYRVDKSNIVSR